MMLARRPLPVPVSPSMRIETGLLAAEAERLNTGFNKWIVTGLPLVIAKAALSLDGNDVIALNDLAWILAEIRKRPDEALPLAVKAERLAPQSASVMDTLGWIHYRRQSYAEAERLLTLAAERNRSNGLVQFHLGMTYAKLGRKIDAASALRRAAQLDPKLADREKIDQLIKEIEG